MDTIESGLVVLGVILNAVIWSYWIVTKIRRRREEEILVWYCPDCHTVIPVDKCDEDVRCIHKNN
jgi:elongation factor P hydroxylase